MNEMNTLRIAFIAFSVAWLIPAQSAQAGVVGGVNPTYVRIKLYELRISPNQDCSSSIVIFYSEKTGFMDVTDCTFDIGVIPSGTYPCVMYKISDHIQYQPAANQGSHGVCVGGKGNYTLDIAHDQTAVDPDGTRHKLGPQGAEDLVWVYFKTHANSNESIFSPAGGIAMASPLVASGDRATTIAMDFSGKIGEVQQAGKWICGCDFPVMSFQ